MAPEKKNPAAGREANGVSGASRAAGQTEHNTTAKRVKPCLRVCYEGRTLTVTGRKAQTLALLMERGAKGFTSGEASPLGWARRTSSYVHELRELGLPIVTQWEDAGDTRVGRYILTAPVVVVQGGAA